MDIKILLLKSLSFKRPIHGSRRIQCGKSCIVINYVITGSILNITTIKIHRRHETWAQRIKCYKKDLRSYRSTKNNLQPSRSSLPNTLHIEKCDKETLTEHLNKHSKNSQTETSNHYSTSKHATTQTIEVGKYAKEVQTETIKHPAKLRDMFKLGSTTKPKPVQNQTVSLTTTAQQTIASARFGRSMSSNNKMLLCSKTTSTMDINVECKAIQCKRTTQTRASNTDTNTRDSFAQVEHDLSADNTSLPEELKKQCPLPAEEIAIFVYMLNEIGETVIHQNELLKSNTDLLKQMMTTQNSKCFKESSHSSASTQTDHAASSEKKNSFCQTNPECIKHQRKLLLFKKDRKSHKKSENSLKEVKKPVEDVFN